MMFLLSLPCYAQGSAVGGSAITYREFLNDLVSKEHYLDDALLNLKTASDKLGSEKFKRVYADFVSRNGGYTEISILNYGYRDGAEGGFFNFQDKDEYDRFKEYARFYNIRGVLNIYRKSLLEGLSPEQKKDLLQRELLSATRSYQVSDYNTARIQFEDIYENYSGIYRNLDDVLFLQAESNFGARFYTEARGLYEKLIKEYPSSKQVNASVHKILFMDYVYDNANRFRKDYDRYALDLAVKDEFYNKIQILAATIEYQNSEPARAIDILNQIPSDSKQRRLIEYALGAIYNAMGDVNAADSCFKRVVNMPVWPWDTKMDSYIKNSALVQLGHTKYLKGNKVMDEARKIFAAGDTKAAYAVRKKAIAQYEDAERQFNQVSKGYQERELADLGRAWVKFKERNYDEAQQEIDVFLRSNRTSENLYQALFLSGYVTQKKNPTEPEFALRDYYFVYNGMAANSFLDRFFAQKRLFREQKMNTEALIVTSTVPEEVTAATDLRDAQAQILSLLSFDRKSVALTEKSLIPADRQGDLDSRQKRLVAVREELSSKGLPALATIADRSQASLAEMLKLAVEPISDEVRLFAEHAPVIFAAEVTDYRRAIEEYKRSVKGEFDESQNRLTTLAGRDKDSDPKAALLGSYYINNATLLRNQSNALEVLLYERNFYNSGNTVEKAGTMAQYAFSGLIYNEISNRRAQVETYQRIVDIFKRAAKKKSEQLAFFLKELEAYGPDGAAVLTEADKLQKEFDDVYNDFRKAFFIGTDYLKFGDRAKQGTLVLP